LTIYVLISH